MGVYGRAPELLQNGPHRELVYDRPRPETWPDRGQCFKTMLTRFEAFLSEHGRRHQTVLKEDVGKSSETPGSRPGLATPVGKP